MNPLEFILGLIVILAAFFFGFYLFGIGALIGFSTHYLLIYFYPWKFNSMIGQDYAYVMNQNVWDRITWPFLRRQSWTPENQPPLSIWIGAWLLWGLGSILCILQFWDSILYFITH